MQGPRTKSSYTCGTARREMLRASPRLGASPRAPNLMTTAFGTDNRFPLPPFGPIGWGADAVFGQFLSRIDPDAMFGYLPFTIVQNAVEMRKFWPGEVLPSAGATDLRGMFCARLRECPESAGSPADALRTIGRELAGFCGGSLAEFHDRLAAAANRAAGEEIRFLEDRRAKFGAPGPPWTEDRACYVGQIARNRGTRQFGISAELLHGRDEDEALRLARGVVAGFGRLLSVWPDALDGARDLQPELLR